MNDKNTVADVTQTANPFTSNAANGSTGHQHDDADRPHNSDLRDEPDDKQDNSENDHVQLPVIAAILLWSFAGPPRLAESKSPVPSCSPSPGRCG